ncbi:anti-repressor SinI family protein [Halobacillus sp. A5]|nr:anti-repressor SinI family protein [Halobacillus sp. A5]MCP3028067.1 anti-repressor SinI family protein [Halobacillus sp. A5]
MMKAIPDQKALDTEWVKLVKEARDLGLTIEEVREFIKMKSSH